MHDSLSLELDNFNAKNIQNTIENADFVPDGGSLKFVNNCTDNLDVSIFSVVWNQVDCLKIESKGPISVNANVSTIAFHSQWQTKFNKNTIFSHRQQDTRASSSFGRSSKFAWKTIQPKSKVLWIDTKIVDEDKKAEYDNEMKRILGKFQNLESLKLNESFDIDEKTDEESDEYHDYDFVDDSE